ncbi:Protein PLM2 [Escovopsis weberi]|uniref:Protein PLM2 n=1 Tax=Escovopsis weberi TaxID=150374 RepID=A0A0M8MX48_ESCWE|nr:Protein PLM2 [Escovopsis weberi]
MDLSPSRKATSFREPTLPALSAAGIKRPAPSLLPPFEPSSSSPGCPRPSKRLNTGAAHLRYPTPLPTSSTGILSSSPVRRPSQIRATTERAPLSAVPSVELNENGDVLLMGRSSNSSHFQLSSNRLVSRVHVKARYVPAAGPLETNKIEITCNGWNGLKLHCQGRTWELLKGDSFTSETQGTEIMVDVHDARVMVQWPKRAAATTDAAGLSDSSWEDSPPRSLTRAAANALLQSSPLRRNTRIESPVSPTPGAAGISMSETQRLRSLLQDDDDKNIEIYEDDEEPELPEHKREHDRENDADVTIGARVEATEGFSDEADEEGNPDEENDPVVHSFGPYGADISARLASVTTKSSPHRALMPPKRPAYKLASNEALAHGKDTTTDEEEAKPRPRPKARKPLKQDDSDVENKRQDDGQEEEGEGEEEEGQVFQAHDEEEGDDDYKEEEEQEEEQEEGEVVEDEEEEEEQKQQQGRSKQLAEFDEAISNHVINQLAYSRLSSTPLSTIMQNLPAEQTKGLSKDLLREVIETTACIGIIRRQGKDAAGKPLESEYYYVPEKDTDSQRRAAVVDGLRKPSLRACRKQHKQYYWKRPKTP